MIVLAVLGWLFLLALTIYFTVCLVFIGYATLVGFGKSMWLLLTFIFLTVVGWFVVLTSCPFEFSLR